MTEIIITAIAIILIAFSYKRIRNYKNIMETYARIKAQNLSTEKYDYITKGDFLREAARLDEGAGNAATRISFDYPTLSLFRKGKPAAYSFIVNGQSYTGNIIYTANIEFLKYDKELDIAYNKQAPSKNYAILDLKKGIQESTITNVILIVVALIFIMFGGTTQIGM